jgi:hypothetical protein
MVSLQIQPEDQLGAKRKIRQKYDSDKIEDK